MERYKSNGDGTVTHIMPFTNPIYRGISRETPNEDREKLFVNSKNDLISYIKNNGGLNN